MYDACAQHHATTMIKEELVCHILTEENQTHAKEGKSISIALRLLRSHYGWLNIESSRPLKGRLAQSLENNINTSLCVSVSSCSFHLLNRCFWRVL